MMSAWRRDRSHFCLGSRPGRSMSCVLALLLVMAALPGLTGCSWFFVKDYETAGANCTESAAWPITDVTVGGVEIALATLAATGCSEVRCGGPTIAVITGMAVSGFAHWYAAYTGADRVGRCRGHLQFQESEQTAEESAAMPGREGP